VEAERNFAAAIELDRNYAEAHVNLGTLYQRQGTIPEAVQHYREAVRANPRMFAAHANLGAILASQGRVQEAIVHWRAAAKLKPDEPQIRRELERLEQSLK
jgi:Tfp pilus assembly protein PilF